jgi:hypothetical protein
VRASRSGLQVGPVLASICCFTRSPILLVLSAVRIHFDFSVFSCSPNRSLAQCLGFLGLSLLQFVLALDRLRFPFAVTTCGQSAPGLNIPLKASIFVPCSSTHGFWSGSVAQIHSPLALLVLRFA